MTSRCTASSRLRRIDWGLRDYQLPPLLWGGSDECEHEWGDSIGAAGQGGQSDFSTSGLKKDGRPEDSRKRTLTENAKELERLAPKSSGQFCRLCGCWRGSLGLEPTPELYIEHLVGIFREVRRVLRDDGTLWLNMAGCYAGGNYRGGGPDTASSKQLSNVGTVAFMSKRQTLPGGFKPKDWVPIPWMLGMALQADGWWLRSPIIWAKGLSFCETYSGSVMPESCKDRPTSSYEYVLLLTKTKTYYYDQDAVSEICSVKTHSRGPSYHKLPKAQPFGEGVRFNESWSKATWAPVSSRNLRSVWAINPHPFKEAHFATFPPKLVEPCIKAGTSERGCCPECGKGWDRVVEKHIIPDRSDGRPYRPDGGQYVMERGESKTLPKQLSVSTTLGWRPGCSCYDALYRTEFPKARRRRKRDQRDAWTGGWWDRVRKRPGKSYWQVEPCVILDCFSGSGTTVMVALRLGRRAVGIDLSEAYCQMARRRIIDDCPMLNIPGEATE